MNQLQQQRKLIENLEVELDGYLASLDPKDPEIIPEIYKASRCDILATAVEELAARLRTEAREHLLDYIKRTKR